MEKMYFGVVKTVEINNNSNVVINLHEDGTTTLHVIATGFTKDIESIINGFAQMELNSIEEATLKGDNGNDYKLTIGLDGSIKIERFEYLNISVSLLEELVKTLKEEETLHLEYCPHCGSSAKEQGVESHTSGFACNLCQKWIPFRSECTVIEEVKSNSPVKILWFSRHQMTIEQYQDLERIYGAIDVSVIDMTISHADEIKWDIENNDVLAVVAPPELLHEFVNYPGGRPVIVAKSERVLVKSEDGTESKVVFKFTGWDLMEEYTIKTRRL